MAKKATNFEVSQRVKEVVEFLLDGLSRYEIQEYARTEWDISRSPVDVLIRYANKRITRMAEMSEKKSFDRIRLRLERQYRRAIQAKEIRTSLLAIEAMRKLYSLDKPPKAAIDDAGKAVIPVVLNRVTNFLTLIKDSDPKAYEAFIKVTTDNGALVKPKQITKGKRNEGQKEES